jgi:hypothetical protein
MARRNDRQVAQHGAPNWNNNRRAIEMKLTTEQYDQLLRPLANSRVANRSQAGRQLAYLEAWDVKAHLIRIFGFGNWSADVLSAELMFEDKTEKGHWNVGYKVIMRLRLHAEDMLSDTTYTEAAVGQATLPQRGEAHDMAVKTAESDALKRAAINLGTQFGLSLYDNGNRNDVIQHTLVTPPDYVRAAQVKPAEDENRLPVEWDRDVVEGIVAEVQVAEDEASLKGFWELAATNGWLDEPLPDASETTLRNAIVARLKEIRGDDE